MTNFSNDSEFFCDTMSAGATFESQVRQGTIVSDGSEGGECEYGEQNSTEIQGLAHVLERNLVSFSSYSAYSHSFEFVSERAS